MCSEYSEKQAVPTFDARGTTKLSYTLHPFLRKKLKISASLGARVSGNGAFSPVGLIQIVRIALGPAFGADTPVVGILRVTLPHAAAPTFTSILSGSGNL